MLAPRQREPDAPFALGEAARSWRDLLADAEALSRSLAIDTRHTADTASAGTEVMVACADRYLCAVALLAVWRGGRIAALPPNGRPETIDRLCAERGIPLILHDGGGDGGVDVRTRLGDASGAGDGPEPPPAFAPDRLLASVYTSGSTGAPLRCPKTAAQLCGEAALLVRLWELGPGTRVLATVPPHHLYGLLFGVMVPFMGGGAVVRTTPLHATTIAAQATDHRVNVVVSVPAHLHAVATLAAGALPPLARIFSSGAPLDAATAAGIAAAAGIPVTEVLGSSETGGIAWRQSGGPERDQNGWQAFPGVSVEPDEDGTMRIRSPFAATDPKEWIRGADRIRARPDGRFDLLGRTDGVVKIGGSRVALAEVERALRDIPGVADAAVVSVDTPSARQHELWAAVVAPTLTVATLRQALLRRLDPIGVPRRFRIVAALPREENGKLVRARLLALFDETAGAPERPEERTIAITIPRDWHFFRGHFDGFPVLAAVVQLNEIVLRELRACWPAHRHLRRITALKFRKPIGPGDVLELALVRTPPARVAFELRRGTTVASSGTFEFEPDA